jgi:hypothetical protein
MKVEEGNFDIQCIHKYVKESVAPCSEVNIEEVIVAQLVKEFPISITFSYTYYI